jgi:hypothetical protein
MRDSLVFFLNKEVSDITGASLLITSYNFEVVHNNHQDIGEKNYKKKSLDK